MIMNDGLKIFLFFLILFLLPVMAFSKKTPMFLRGGGNDLVIDDIRGEESFRNLNPKGKVVQDVNLLTGRLYKSIALTSISTPSGLSYPLAISYGSMNIPKINKMSTLPTGNLGFGWDISYPYITRNSMGTLRPEDDRLFCSFGTYGGGELVLLEDDVENNVYQLTSDPTIRVYRHDDANGDPDKWRAFFNDGSMMEFGGDGKKLKKIFTNEQEGYISLGGFQDLKSVPYQWNLSVFNSLDSPNEDITFEYEKIRCGTMEYPLGDINAALKKIQARKSNEVYKTLSFQIDYVGWNSYDCSDLDVFSKVKSPFKYESIEVSGKSGRKESKIVFRKSLNTKDYYSGELISGYDIANVDNVLESGLMLTGIGYFSNNAINDELWSFMNAYSFSYTQTLSDEIKDENLHLAAVSDPSGILSEYKYSYLTRDKNGDTDQEEIEVATSINSGDIILKNRTSGQTFCTNSLCFDYTTLHGEWGTTNLYNGKGLQNWNVEFLNDHNAGIPTSSLNVYAKRGNGIVKELELGTNEKIFFKFFLIGDSEFGVYSPADGELTVYEFDPYQESNSPFLTSKISLVERDENGIIEEINFLPSQDYILIERKWKEFIDYNTSLKMPIINSKQDYQSRIWIAEKNPNLGWTILTSTSSSCNVSNKPDSDNSFSEHNDYQRKVGNGFDDCFAYRGSNLHTTVGSGFWAATNYTVNNEYGNNFIEIWELTKDGFQSKHLEIPVVSEVFITPDGQAGSQSKGSPNDKYQSFNWEEDITRLEAHGRFLLVSSSIDATFQRNVVFYVSGAGIQEVFHRVTTKEKKLRDDNDFSIANYAPYYDLNDKFYWGKDFFIVDQVSDSRYHKSTYSSGCSHINRTSGTIYWNRKTYLYELGNSELPGEDLTINSLLLDNYFDNLAGDRCGSSNHEDVDKTPNSQPILMEIYGDYLVYDLSGGYRSYINNRPILSAKNSMNTKDFTATQGGGVLYKNPIVKLPNVSAINKVELPQSFSVSGVSETWKGLYDIKVQNNTMFALAYLPSSAGGDYSLFHNGYDGDDYFNSIINNTPITSNTGYFVWITADIDLKSVPKMIRNIRALSDGPLISTKHTGDEFFPGAVMGMRKKIVYKQNDDNEYEHLIMLAPWYYNGNDYSGDASEIVVSEKVVSSTINDPETQKKIVSNFDYNDELGVKFDFLSNQVLHRGVSVSNYLINEGLQRDKVSQNDFLFYIDPIVDLTDYNLGYPVANPYIGLVKKEQSHIIETNDRTTLEYLYSEPLYYNPKNDLLFTPDFTGKVFPKEIKKTQIGQNGIPIVSYQNFYQHNYFTGTPKYSFSYTEGAGVIQAVESRQMVFDKVGECSKCQYYRPVSNYSYRIDESESITNLIASADTSVPLFQQNFNDVEFVSGTESVFSTMFKPGSPRTGGVAPYLVEKHTYDAVPSNDYNYQSGESAKPNNLSRRIINSWEVTKTTNARIEEDKVNYAGPLNDELFLYKTTKFTGALVEAEVKNSRFHNVFVETVEDATAGKEGQLSTITQTNKLPAVSFEKKHSGLSSFIIHPGEEFLFQSTPKLLSERQAGIEIDFWVNCGENTVPSINIYLLRADQSMRRNVEFTSLSEQHLLTGWVRYTAKIPFEDFKDYFFSLGSQDVLHLKISSNNVCFVDDIIQRELGNEFTIFTYDEELRPLQSFGNDGIILTRDYDLNGQLIGVRDEQGRLFTDGATQSYGFGLIPAISGEINE